jgi:hypothetical protein
MSNNIVELKIKKFLLSFCEYENIIKYGDNWRCEYFEQECIIFDLMFLKNNEDNYNDLKLFFEKINYYFKYYLSITIIKLYWKNTYNYNNCYLLYIISRIGIILKKIDEYYNFAKTYFDEKSNDILFLIICKIKFYSNYLLELIFKFISNNISKEIIDYTVTN